MVVDGCYSGSK